MVVAEALASGTPVIATDVGGVRHMMKEGISGLVVPPDDALALARALERVEEFWRLPQSHLLRAAGAEKHMPRTVALATKAVYERVARQSVVEE